MTIPSSVTSIGYYAFCYCTSLKSVSIPSSVTSVGYGAFRDCPLDNQSVRAVVRVTGFWKSRDVLR